MKTHPDILQELKEIGSDSLLRSCDTPYLPETTYFDTLADRLLLRVKAQESARQRVPEDYFEQLPQDVLGRIAVSRDASKPFFPVWSQVIRWAAAAIFICMVGSGLMQRGVSGSHPYALTYASSEQIYQYFERHIDDVDGFWLEEEVAGDIHSSAPDHLTDEDITQYLNASYWP